MTLSTGLQQRIAQQVRWGKMGHIGLRKGKRPDVVMREGERRVGMGFGRKRGRPEAQLAQQVGRWLHIHAQQVGWEAQDAGSKRVKGRWERAAEALGRWGWVRWRLVGADCGRKAAAASGQGEWGEGEEGLGRADTGIIGGAAQAQPPEARVASRTKRATLPARVSRSLRLLALVLLGRPNQGERLTPRRVWLALRLSA